MRDCLDRLERLPFPAIRRGVLTTLQLNLGYVCNQTCSHCHVEAGPRRTETATAAVVDLALDYMRRQGIGTLDLTGGAPELNAHFRRLVGRAREAGIHVMDRCNLTVLEEPNMQDLAGFLAEQRVEVIASLPCYLESNVDRQRGRGVFDASIRGLQRLNAEGYGQPGSGLTLNLVYNPQGADLPPPQAALESEYRRVLAGYGIVFNRLFTLANMPIRRFGASLIARNQLDGYLTLLEDAHQPANLDHVMCRTMISVDWQGYVYDCDFNQMLGLPLGATGRRTHLSELLDVSLDARPIRVAGHCYGCTAGQGSSCGGALGGAGADGTTAVQAAE